MTGDTLRHLTVTGFLVHKGRVLLHWHRRNAMWLPMGGHIEPDEDPVTAVLREVREESGVDAAIIPTTEPLPFTNIGQLPPPVTVLIAPVRGCSVAQRLGWRGPIEHVDLVYYCRPRAGIAVLNLGDAASVWLTAAEVAHAIARDPGDGSPPAYLADDVRALALDALTRGNGD